MTCQQSTTCKQWKCYCSTYSSSFCWLMLQEKFASNLSCSPLWSVQFSSVQVKMASMRSGKPVCSATSFRRCVSVVLLMVHMLVWLKMALLRPISVDQRPLLLCTPLFFRRSRLWWCAWSLACRTFLGCLSTSDLPRRSPLNGGNACQPVILFTAFDPRMPMAVYAVDLFQSDPLKWI